MQEAAKLRSLGKYNLIASLGQGGMAKVYLALMAGPAGFNKLLVVKVLRDDVPSGSDEGIRMFWDEARLSAQLVHPNIVHTYEVGEIQGHYFLAMEYLDGQAYRTVQTRAQQSNGLPLHEECRILSEAARGLHYSHTLKGFNGEPLGVVHRDVSPQNIFITYDGQVKVLDFGIAKTHDAGHMTQVGVIKGKLDYIAPEQLRGDSIDGRADVFALGAMLWEAITGQRFSGGRKVTEVAKVHARITGAEAKVRALKPDVPEELAQIVDKAIALDRDHRYPDAASFADAIEEYLEKAGLRPTAKTLGALVSSVFESERVTMHKLIDQQVNALKKGAVELGEQTGELPRLGFQDTRSTSGLYLGPVGDDQTVSGRQGMTGMTNMTNMTAGGIPAAGTGDVAAPKSHAKMIAIAAVVLIGGAAAFFGTREAEKPIAHDTAGRDDKTAPAAVATADKPAAPEPVAAPTTISQPQQEVAGASIVLELKAQPPEAHVSLDGAPVTLPFTGEFRKSTAFHYVEATLEGYRPYKRLIPFNQDQNIEIVLEKAPQQAPRRAGRDRDDRRSESTPEPQPTTKPAAPAPAATPADDAPKSRLKRGLDVSDPYAN